MRRARLAGPIALVVALVVALVASPVAAKRATPWAAARSPSRGAAAAIGGTSAGCLAGGVELPRRKAGVRVMRPARRRHFAHPALAAVLRALGDALAAERLGELALGDASQPRGGPAPDGHASHQTGLDVDIWYAVGGTRRRPAPVPMVDAEAKAPTAAWGPRQIRLPRLAATQPAVDRIFVNPVLKRALCTSASTPAERVWLGKPRPWWGHDEHFHPRLACPADSVECVPQAAVPPGDGCAELDRWLDPEKAEAQAAERAKYRDRIATKPALPEKCARLVE